MGYFANLGETMKQLELFAGIGGFGLAGHWAGIETVVQVEIDEYCQKILQKYFPNAKRYRDIKEFDGTKYRGAIDIISGGFPCQPYSLAGKRLGKDDDRHLWPEMLRVIREVQPQWVVGENVRGLVSWSNGLVFEEVCADLETAGYEVQPFILPAASVGAPHFRYRIWFVAHATQVDDSRNAGTLPGANGGQERGNVSESCCASAVYAANASKTVCKQPSNTRTRRDGLTDICSNEDDVNTNQAGRKEQYASAIANGQRQRSGRNIETWDEWPTQSPVCGRNDGVSNRVDRIAALGNAIVPQVAYQIFKSIVEYETTFNRH